MAMPVAGDTVRHSAILDIRGWATAVARASQRYLQLALNHRLDELTHTLTQPDFDRVKPIVEKMDRRLCFRLQDRRRRASLAHGVVSTGAPTPGLLWVSPPGDYAIVNSNHIPDGTALVAGTIQNAPQETLVKLRQNVGSGWRLCETTRCGSLLMGIWGIWCGWLHRGRVPERTTAAARLSG